MKSIIDWTTPDEPVLVITRTFDAPRALVWAAFTDPKHVMKWFGGQGFTNVICEMDVRPGGAWHHVMRTPDGTEISMDVVFVEVVPPEKLVWRDGDYGKRPPGSHPASTMTVTLEEDGKRTKWKLVTRFATMADREAARQTGFARIVAEGAEKLADLWRTS